MDIRWIMEGHPPGGMQCRCRTPMPPWERSSTPPSGSTTTDRTATGLSDAGCNAPRGQPSPSCPPARSPASPCLSSSVSSWCLIPRGGSLRHGRMVLHAHAVGGGRPWRKREFRPVAAGAIPVQPQCNPRKIRHNMLPSFRGLQCPVAY